MMYCIYIGNSQPILLPFITRFVQTYKCNILILVFITEHSFIIRSTSCKHVVGIDDISLKIIYETNRIY